MWASIRSLFPIMIPESKSVIFAKEKGKNINSFFLGVPLVSSGGDSELSLP